MLSVTPARTASRSSSVNPKGAGPPASGAAATVDERARTVMRRLYAAVVRTSDRMLITDARSAELTKYACNAYLASRISFMNDMANLADSVGADIELVRRGMGSDPRIGYRFLEPGEISIHDDRWLTYPWGVNGGLPGARGAVAQCDAHHNATSHAVPPGCAHRAAAAQAERAAAAPANESGCRSI